MAARVPTWVLALAPAVVLSPLVWVLPEDSSPGDVLVWVVLALAVVVGAGVAFACGERGGKLVLYGLVGLAGAIGLMPVLILWWLCVGFLLGPLGSAGPSVP
jgi:hypothetical protein